MFSKWFIRLNHRLNEYLLADYRGSRFDGYCWAMIGCVVLGLGVIYL